MRLPDFIRANVEPIADKWEEFARSLGSVTDGMSIAELRDHVRGILAFLAEDIEKRRWQSHRGGNEAVPVETSSDNKSPGIHGALRQEDGFSIDQMVSEFRALRSNIIEMWENGLTESSIEDLRDLARFNESIDQALTESIAHFSQRLEESRNLFLGMLGHDLRNPLGAIRMSAELALLLGNKSERQPLLISQIVSSADRAAEIVSYLLDLTSAQNGTGLSIDKKHMDMAKVTLMHVEEMRILHPEQAFQLNTLGDTEGEWDAARIGQVLSNLLGNAVQYGDKSQPISVTVTGGKDSVSLAVHNHGIPIQSEAVGHIFNSMTRGDAKPQDTIAPNSHVKTSNLGLGLYITKEIVTAHGGTIGVVSKLGEGTTFTAVFPR